MHALKSQHLLVYTFLRRHFYISCRTALTRAARAALWASRRSSMAIWRVLAVSNLTGGKGCETGDGGGGGGEDCCGFEEVLTRFGAGGASSFFDLRLAFGAFGGGGASGAS